MKAQDILNNTDPEELRNIIHRLRQQLDGSLRPPPTMIVIQAPGQYPPTSIPDPLPVNGIESPSGTLTVHNDLEVEGGANLDADETYNIGGVPHKHIYFSTNNISNPPTEQEIIDAIGSPDTDKIHNLYHLDDNGAHQREYLVTTDGTYWFFSTLAKAVPSAISVNVDSTVTLATETGQWFGRATIEVLDTGIVVLVYLETTEHSDNTVEVVHIRFSNDDGITWTAEDTYLDGAPVSVGLPPGASTSDSYGPGDTYIWQAPNGDLYLHTWKVDYAPGGNMSGCWRTKSIDGGKAWGTWEQILFTGITNDDRAFITEQHFILNGVIYMTGREYQDNPDTNFNPVRNFLAKSTDNGSNWELVSYITSFAENTHEAAMEYIGNNTILVFMRDTNDTKSYKRTSTDMGASWGTLTEVQTALGGAIGRSRVYTRSHLKGAENWWQDHVLIMNGYLHDNPTSYPRRNCVWISRDQGATWFGPFYIDVQTEDAGYGDIIYNPGTDQYIVVNYQGTLNEANLKQYNLSITGI